MKHEIRSTLELPEVKGMTLKEIKAALAIGRKVHWSNTAYDVILDSVPQYLINCNLNDHCIGLTWTDGTTMNGREMDFFSPAVEFGYEATICTGDDAHTYGDRIHDITNAESETVESEIFDALESLCLDDANEKLKEKCS